MMTLDKQKIGVICTVEKVFCRDDKLKRRILELGFVEGQKVTLSKKSLFGKVFIVCVRGVFFSMKRDILKYVSVI